ncbi:hypothetical protein PS6_004617 [Mucor atramentarius]
MVVCILNFSKTSGAASKCFATFCSALFVWFSAVCRLWCYLQVICIATFLEKFSGSEYKQQAQDGTPGQH